MENGIYFFGQAGWQWVAEVDYAINYQANDLTSPDSLELSYTNQFNLPNTLAIQKILEHAEQLDAGGQHPYKLIPARIIEDEETIFDGRAELKGFQGIWKVVIYENHRGLFDSLGEKSIRDLDLSRLDHPWTLDEINARAGATEGVCYPILDYGTVSEGIVPQDAIFPSVFVRDVVAQSLQEEGYKPVGAWLEDPLFKAMVLPFCEAEPVSRDQNWVDARRARVTLADASTIDLVNRGLNRIQPFSIDNRDPFFYDGKTDNYNPTLFQYKADTAMRLRVVAFQEFVAHVHLGAPEVMLIIEVNGSNVHQGYWSKTLYNTSILVEKRDRIEVDTSVLLKKDDVVKIRLTVRKRTNIAQYQVKIFQTSEYAYASFEPDPIVYTGDKWLVARNLPDLKCSLLLKAIAFQMSGWFNIDNQRKTVELIKLTDLTNNRVNAVDWSAKVEESEAPEVQFRIEPYAQKNYVKYKEQDGVDKGYGDGVIRCENTAQSTETALFELPFSATMPSTRQVGDFGSPLLIETRTIIGKGDTIQINKNSTSPRIILVEPTKTFEVATQILDINGNIKPATVTLTGCWFARRENSIVTNENNFSLAFSPVPGQVSEVPLIGRYFGGLKRVLRRPRVFIPSLYLRPVDMATLNPNLPIRLKNVRIGDIEIAGGYFYLNRVNNYQSGKTCTGVLIAF
ncbi:hypothetical protein [Larkinella humicola]|uniref:Uncharacterized protein n=1 Tax=Larkinella humicola TaxID=2607654 RepID=A0A5N1JAN8_9BACT|nr:hypothetical protein [Larkinella humicola]KAA9349742.1 hypothetical protein F0P93_20025 [Larkinella humicola]